MPELPEVETTGNGIRPYVEQQIIIQLEVREPRLRWPVPPELPKLVANKPVLSLKRRGKYLLFEFERGVLLVHLGMSGSLRVVECAEEPLRKHDHVIWQFQSHQLRFHDPRRFGCVLWTQAPVNQHPLLSGLGPEPLTADFSAEYLYAIAKKRKVAIKSLIMNSKVVVGVGNIYACEALFKAGISPKRTANRVSLARIERLVAAIKEVLQQAIQAGGTTLRDFVNGFDQPGYFKQQLSVYGRADKPCVSCAEPLTEIRLQQRSTVFCHRCQR